MMTAGDRELPGMPREAAPVSWVVAYRAPRSRVWDRWLHISGVPATVARQAVEDAVQTWAQWPAWAARTSLGGVVRVSRVPAGRKVEAGKSVPWLELAPASRRVTFEVAGPIHAAMVRASRLRGESLAFWCASVVELAAQADVRTLSGGE